MYIYVSHYALYITKSLNFEGHFVDLELLLLVLNWSVTTGTSVSTEVDWGSLVGCVVDLIAGLRACLLRRTTSPLDSTKYERSESFSRHTPVSQVLFRFCSAIVPSVQCSTQEASLYFCHNSSSLFDALP